MAGDGPRRLQRKVLDRVAGRHLDGDCPQAGGVDRLERRGDGELGNQQQAEHQTPARAVAALDPPSPVEVGGREGREAVHLVAQNGLEVALGSQREGCRLLKQGGGRQTDDHWAGPARPQPPQHGAARFQRPEGVSLPRRRKLATSLAPSMRTITASRKRVSPSRLRGSNAAICCSHQVRTSLNIHVV